MGPELISLTTMVTTVVVESVDALVVPAPQEEQPGKKPTTRNRRPRKPKTVPESAESQ